MMCFLSNIDAYHSQFIPYNKRQPSNTGPYCETESQVVDVAAAESTPEIARKLEDLVKARHELPEVTQVMDFHVVSRGCTSSGS